MRRAVEMVFLVLVVAACGDDGGMVDSGGGTDAGRDAAGSDGGGVDSGGSDAGGSDAGGGSDASGGTDAGGGGTDAGGGGTDAGGGGGGSDAGGEMMAVDAGTRSCGDVTCPEDERCVLTCCRVVGMCTWRRHGEDCPEGLMPLDPATSGVICPPIPGIPTEVLCADGDCPSPRPRSCMPVTEGECTGADATCNVCGDECYGEPPASGTRPDVVICRPRE